jgi:hypothetical protein
MTGLDTATRREPALAAMESLNRAGRP